METPNCPTCGKPMEPNPPRKNAGGSYGAPGDPAFVCLTDDKAHDDARKARADEAKRLLAEAKTIREVQKVKADQARRIGALETAKEKE